MTSAVNVLIVGASRWKALAIVAGPLKMKKISNSNGMARKNSTTAPLGTRTHQ
jgi:hypothetical protein